MLVGEQLQTNRLLRFVADCFPGSALVEEQARVHAQCTQKTYPQLTTLHARPTHPQTALFLLA
jgi:hypothetical protein